MSNKATTQLFEAMLDAAGTAFAGCFLYAFAGPVPADAGDALNMVADHTQCFRLTESDDGTTGLNFDAAVGMLLPKLSTEDWLGLIAFDGVDDGETTLTPSFFRICPPGDNGRGVATGPRVQGTLGGPSSGRDIELGAATVTANGSNQQRLDSYYLDLSTIG